ncbi:MAG: hypothetical protein M3R21_03760 [Candidatus Dormibacteraeota bacterium]|nr:hypothetical protein [Candidatus Dormibacteraeota bacterium]
MLHSRIEWSFAARRGVHVRRANGDGSVFYGVILLTVQTNMQSFTSEAAPILKGIQWMLK